MEVVEGDGTQEFSFSLFVIKGSCVALQTYKIIHSKIAPVYITPSLSDL